PSGYAVSGDGTRPTPQPPDGRQIRGPWAMNAVLDTAVITTDAEVQHRRRRSRMIRALLAGGLVLGVGTAVTLAAWNDSEFASGTFRAGTFDLEGSTDGTTFSQ